MKKILILISLFIILIACKKNENIKPIKIAIKDTLTVFSVKSYNTDFWDDVAYLFETEYNAKINYTFFSDATILLDSLKNIYKTQNHFPDAVIGIDKYNEVLTSKDTLFIDFKPYNYRYIRHRFMPRKHFYLTPFAYNYPVWYYNIDFGDFPKTLGVLQDHNFDDDVILFDPKKNFLGRDYMLWCLSVYRNIGIRRYWCGIKSSVHSFEDNFEKASVKFYSGEASVMLFPIINPYISDKDYFFATEGYYSSVFYAGIPKKADFPEKSQQFINFILNDDFQRKLFDKKIAIPISDNVLNYVLESFNPKKSGINYYEKLKDRYIRNNKKTMNRLWKRTFKKRKRK